MSVPTLPTEQKQSLVAAAQLLTVSAIASAVADQEPVEGQAEFNFPDIYRHWLVSINGTIANNYGELLIALSRDETEHRFIGEDRFGAIVDCTTQFRRRGKELVEVKIGGHWLPLTPTTMEGNGLVSNLYQWHLSTDGDYLSAPAANATFLRGDVMLHGLSEQGYNVTDPQSVHYLSWLNSTDAIIFTGSHIWYAHTQASYEAAALIRRRAIEGRVFQSFRNQYA